MAITIPENIDLATARAYRDAALAAYEKALEAASVSSSGGRSWSPHPLGDLMGAVREWQRVIRALEADAAGSKNTRVSTATWT